MKKAIGFISYGSKAKEYLISLGANPKKIEIAINTVDTEFFRDHTEKICQKIQEDDKKHLLCISHLTERKQIDLLLKILKKILDKRKDFILELVGDGPQIVNLKKLVKELDIENYVKFEGFKQKSDLPEYFARAFCLLFPTRFDIWGLILNEAMSAGIPCLVSVNAGAAIDLIKDKISGFLTDFEDSIRTEKIISFILDNQEMCIKIGKKAKNFIEKNATINKSVQGFINIIKRNIEMK